MFSWISGAAVARIATVNLVLQLRYLLQSESKSIHTFFYSASEKFFFRNDSRIGGQYYKVIYKGYTDESFTTEIPQTRDFEHLGLLGMDLEPGC